jgi:SAM-dependent methyltransferase
MVMYYKEYDSYKEYIKHQSSKLKKMLKIDNKCVSLKNFDKRASRFKEVFKTYLPYMHKANKVLCLGARNGAEVKAFLDLDFKDSIGIDINPGENNKYVIKGDFNNIPFDENSFSNIYSNCIDHILDINIYSEEIYRVLKPEGVLILDIYHLLDFEKLKRKKEVLNKKSFETFCCSDFKDIKNGFKKFKVINKWNLKGKPVLIVIFETKKR